MNYRILVCGAVVAALAWPAKVFPAQPDPAKAHAPLGLLRLRSEAKPNEAAPVPAARYSVDDLPTSGVAGASKGRRNHADYLALKSGREWARPLRGNARDVTFVSFQVYGSQTTIIDIAGARLGLTTGPITGSLQLMYDDSATGAPQWQALNLHFAIAQGAHRLRSA